MVSKLPPVHLLMLSCGALFLLASVTSAQGPAPSVACGLLTVADMCDVLGIELPSELRARMLNGPQKEMSMLNVAEEAAQCGLCLTPVRASLGALAEGHRAPCILHLNDPGHFVLATRFTEEWVQLLDGGEPLVVPRAELSRRYSGHALVRQVREGETPSVTVGLDEFCYAVDVLGVGQMIEHSFALTNRGHGELTIIPPQGSCSGPQVTVDKTSLAAGQTALVSMQSMVRRLAPLMKSAKLLTNSPEEPVIYLTLCGRCPWGLTAHPDVVVVSGEKGHARTRTVRLCGSSQSTIARVVSERGLFAVTVPDPANEFRGMKTWDINLRLDSPVYVGPIADALSVYIDGRDAPVVRIPIVGGILGDVEVQPSTAYFGFVASGAEVRQELSLKSRSGVPFEVRDARSDNPHVRVGSLLKNEGKWVLPVTMDGSAHGAVRGKLSLATDVPGEETISIDVFGYVQEK